MLRSCFSVKHTSSQLCFLSKQLWEKENAPSCCNPSKWTNVLWHKITVNTPITVINHGVTKAIFMLKQCFLGSTATNVQEGFWEYSRVKKLNQGNGASGGRLCTWGQKGRSRLEWMHAVAVSHLWHWLNYLFISIRWLSMFSEKNTDSFERNGCWLGCPSLAELWRIDIKKHLYSTARSRTQKRERETVPVKSWHLDVIQEVGFI